MLRHLVLPLAFLAAPAFASSYYHAMPTTPPAQDRFVARENAWRCAESGCTSGRTATRPAIVCAALVRQVGALRSFSVEGRAFAADALESCNRRAR
jgi:hypothetical protein